MLHNNNIMIKINYKINNQIKMENCINNLHMFLILQIHNKLYQGNNLMKVLINKQPLNQINLTLTLIIVYQDKTQRILNKIPN